VRQRSCSNPPIRAACVEDLGVVDDDSVEQLVNHRSVLTCGSDRSTCRQALPPMAVALSAPSRR
jgi:hypothetical protein